MPWGVPDYPMASVHISKELDQSHPSIDRPAPGDYSVPLNSPHTGTRAEQGTININRNTNPFSLSVETNGDKIKSWKIFNDNTEI